MRSLPLHAFFATVLLASLAARGSMGDVLTESELTPAIIQAAELHGLIFRDYANAADTGATGLVFQAPSCSRSVRITLLDGAFDQDMVSRSQDEPRDVLRYVYIDRTWDEPHPIGFFLQRTKFAALAIFGLTPYQPSWHLLRIEVPAQCYEAQAIDWRSVWERNYFKDRREMKR